MTRGLAAVAALVALYLGVAALGDTRAYSGSDAGGKAATVKVMAERGDWDPDVGYWAASADPEGRLHPLVKTGRIGDRWIQAASLPMVLASVPLWNLAGPPGLLALPIAGAVLAATAARRLARTLGARTGWPAFFLVGAASPVAFYALDFWEHAPALGLFLLAVSLLLGPDVSRRAAVGGGLAAGAAVAVRAEMAIYLLVLSLVVAAVGECRRQWLRRPLLAVASAGVAAAVLGLHQALERAVLGAGIQTARVGSQASSVGSSLGERARDAAVTSVGLFADDSRSALLLGGVAVASLVGLGLVACRGTAVLWRPAAVLSGGLMLFRMVGGLGFVPGSLASAPVGGAAVAASPASARLRVVVAGALVALPLVWAVQWTGDLVPQWGGRYTLATGALLTVAGSVALERSGWRRPAAVVLVALSVAMAGYGLAWHVERTNFYGAVTERIAREPADVAVVSALNHLGREVGTSYGERRWLRASTDDELALAARVLDRLDVERVDVVVLEGRAAPELAGYGRSWSEPLARPGPDVVLNRYERGG